MTYPLPFREMIERFVSMMNLSPTDVLAKTLEDLSTQTGLSYKAAWLRLAELAMLKGQERDAIQATRPEGCWCFGVGGSDVRWLSDRVYRCFEYCECSDGRRLQEIADAFMRQQAAELKAARLRALVDAANVPARFRNFTFNTYPVTAATEVALSKLRYWAEDPEAWRELPTSMLLYGPPSVGKTGLAVAALKSLMESMQDPGLFWAVPDLLDAIRATFDRPAHGPPEQDYANAGKRFAKRLGQQVDDDTEDDSDIDVLTRAKQIPILLLDDLGAEKASTWTNERLFSLINTRHAEDLVTIVTSNLDPKQLAKQLGEKTVARLLEMAGVIRLEGPNLRYGPAKKKPLRVDEALREVDAILEAGQ